MRGLLALFASGDLEPHRRARVERHLADCGACRREVAVWRGQARRLRELRRDPATAPLSPLFWKGVRKEIAEDIAPIERLRLRRSRRVWFAAAAALLVGVGLSLAALHVLGGGAQPAAGPDTPGAVATEGAGDAFEPAVIQPVKDEPAPGFGATPPEKIPF